MTARIRIDHAARRAWKGGRLLALGQREYDLLAHLAQHPQVATFEHLTRSIYGEPLDDRTRRMVQELAGALRRKLGDTAPFRIVVSVRGVGFRMPRWCVAAPAQRVEINGTQWGVLHWERQPDRDGTAVWTLYARPSEVTA